MTIMTIIGTSVASAVVSFGPAALAAGAVLAGLLLVTATVLVIADARATVRGPLTDQPFRRICPM